MTHNEMIVVIQHHKNGGKVQCKSFEPSSKWIEPSHIDSGGFNFGNFDYRAKPEPMVLWAVWCVNTRGFWESSNTLSGAEGLKKRYSEDNPAKTFTIKKFIEEI